MSVTPKNNDEYITDVTTPDGQPAYNIPLFSRFSEAIRSLQDSDPARATTTFNPLVQALIDNTFYLKNTSEANRALIDEIEPYDDTIVKAEIAQLRTDVDNYKYDDTELMAIVTGNSNEISNLIADGAEQERRINNVAQDLSELVFELAIAGLIQTGDMKNVIVDKIEAPGDVILVSGIYEGTKVYI